MLHRFSEGQQTAASGARARTSRRLKAKPLNGAGNQFSVETTAHQNNHTVPVVKIAGAGNKAAVPETPHLVRRRRCRFGARLDHYFVAQGSIKRPQEQSHQPRNDGEREPLAVAEPLGGVAHRAILQAGKSPSRQGNQGVSLKGFGAAPLGRGNSEIGAFRKPVRRRKKVFIMSTHKVSFTARNYPLSRSGTKPSLDDKLDKVFQMAEHMDAKCVYMLDAATHKAAGSHRGPLDWVLP